MKTAPALLTTLGAVTAAAAVAASSEQAWRFRVYLDGREIGYHDYRLSSSGDATRLSTVASFDVTFLKIPVFSYRHENEEVWRNGCLTHIVSTTDTNGDRVRVTGERRGEAFRVDTNDGASELPACVSTFAYWDRSFLAHERLLNPQTGDYMDVEAAFIGEEPVTAAGEETPARRYRLTAEDIVIDLWYSQDDRWLALQSKLANGRVLRYAME